MSTKRPFLSGLLITLAAVNFSLYLLASLGKLLQTLNPARYFEKPWVTWIAIPVISFLLTSLLSALVLAIDYQRPQAPPPRRPDLLLRASRAWLAFSLTLTLLFVLGMLHFLFP